MRKLLDLVKNNKKGLIIGGLVTVAAAVAATLMSGKGEESEEAYDTELEVIEESQDTSNEVVE